MNNTKYKSVYQVINAVCSEFDCKVVMVEHDGDYQGTSVYLIENPNGLFGIIWYHYGSCAGCDAFMSYQEGEYESNSPDIWKSFEEGFRIELKTQEWKTKGQFRSNYHMLFSTSEEVFVQACERYFNGT